MKKNILIVDDDIDILDALKFALTDAGYVVETAINGEYAENLDDTNKNLPALIILDVLLSGKDGRIICRKLKSSKNTELIPVIMVSAHPEAELSSKEAGADDFIAKPFDLVALLDKVSYWVKPGNASSK